MQLMIAASLLVTLSGLSAQGPLNEPITVGVVSQYDFCLMLPPTAGGNIGDTEGTSLSRCFGNVPGSKAVGPVPEGFITSAHFIETPEYVQVSGNMDNARYNLDPTDGGGQYDSAMGGSRPYSMCANYPSYLSYVEPDQSRYCMRCCKPGQDELCAIHRDTIGCVTGMPGTVFGEGFTSNGVPGTKSMAVVPAVPSPVANVTVPSAIDVPALATATESPAKVSQTAAAKPQSNAAFGLQVTHYCAFLITMALVCLA